MGIVLLVEYVKSCMFMLRSKMWCLHFLQPRGLSRHRGMHVVQASHRPRPAAFPRFRRSRRRAAPSIRPRISNFHPSRCIHTTPTTMDASHHSNLSSWEMLQELDPSPIDSPDPELAGEDKEDLLPEIVKDTAGTGARPGSGLRSPPSHVLGLSGLGGGHGAVYYCK